MKDVCKLEFYVPESHLEKVKSAVFATGAGQIGTYCCVSWETLGTGQFKPLPGSDPYIGEQGEVEKVKEFKVELICEPALLDKAVAALREAHPYETPAYQSWMVKISDEPVPGDEEDDDEPAAPAQAPQA